MKKNPHIFTAITTLLFCVAPHSFALDTVFPKGAEVQLKAETPLFFKDAIARTGKAGEKFVVIQDDAAAKKVFVLAKDAAGKEIALNIAEDAVEFAPLDIAALRTSLLQLSANDDLANAAATVDAAATKAPAEAKIQEYRTAILAAKNAQEKVAASALKAEEVKKRVALLSKSAWAAASSRLDPQGGFARSQQMKAEADKLVADSNAQSTTAKTELDSAKKTLAALLAVSEPPKSQSRAITSASTPAPQAQAPSAVVVAAPAPAKPDSRQKAPPEFLELVKTSPDASQQTQFEKGSVYKVTGKFAPYFQIMQVAEGAIMVADARSRSPELLAVLVPEDEKILETINIDTFGNGSPYGYTARAVGKFVKFEDIPLVSGASKRLPVFQISGLNFYDGKFINMAAGK